MPDTKSPRKGSMQYWPRKRAKRVYSRIRNNRRDLYKGTKLCGFAGYKVGMTHVMTKKQNYNTPTKTFIDASYPVTVIECPPLKVIGIRYYKDSEDKVSGSYVVSEVLQKVNDKHLNRKIKMPKKEAKVEDLEYDEMRLLVSTQPSKTGIGKKKPDVFEMVVSGKKDEQLQYAKDKLGKEVTLEEVFAEGEAIDVHAITTGKGTQGPVKRFGVEIRSHKSEKTIRGPGSIAGGWKAQGHMMYRVAFAGQMGFFQRKEYNKRILKISDKLEDINPKGGFVKYGLVKNQYMLLKGSVPGPSKRLIRMSLGVRPSNKVKTEMQEITKVSLASKQK